MGKATKKRKHGVVARAVATPVDGASPAAAAAAATAPLASSSGASLLVGLQSLDASARESACAAVAGVFASVAYGRGDSRSDANWAAVAHLVAGGVIKKLLPRLVDHEPSVRLHAAGALANLAAIGDPKLCERLVQDDALTPAIRCLTEAPCDDASPQLSQLLLQLATALTGMLEASDAAVLRFTNAGGLSAILRAAGTAAARRNPELSAMLLQALHVATDANPALAAQMAATPGVVEALTAVALGHWPGAAEQPPQGTQEASAAPPATARLQAAGALVNAAQSAGPAGLSEEAQRRLASVLLPLLSDALQYDPATLEACCSSLLIPPKPRKSGAGGGKRAAASANGSQNGGEGAMDTDGSDNGEGSEAEMEGQQWQQEEGLTSGKKGKGKGKKKTAPQSDKPREKQSIRTDGQDAQAAERWLWKRECAEPLKLAAEVLTNACSLAADAAAAAAAIGGAASNAGVGGGGGSDEEKDWGSDDEAEAAMDQEAADFGNKTADETAESAELLRSPLLRALTESGALPRALMALQALLPPVTGSQPRSNGAEAQLTSGAGQNGGPAAEENALGAAEQNGTGAAGPNGAPAAEQLPRLPGGIASELAADVGDVRATVALCVANLVQNLPAAAVPDPPAVWAGLCALCAVASDSSAAQPSGSPPLEASARAATEPLTSVMWALARRFARQLFAHALAPEMNDGGGGVMPLLLRLLDPLETPAADARANAAGILGALAAAAAAAAAGAQQQQPLPAIAALRVAEALHGALEDPSALVQGEVLNAIMDAFADEGQPWQDAFERAGLLAVVAAAAPRFRRKVAAEGPALGRDAHAHLRETALNTARFVKYKRSVMAVGSGRR